LERREKMKLTSLDEVLRFAIRKEADEAAFYQMAAHRAKPGVKKTFEEFALEEEGHKKRLEGFDVKKIGQIELKETPGLGIAETVEDVQFDADMSYADLLRMAIKNEERARALYHATAQIAPDSDLKKLLLILSQEEEQHKERLEKIYDEDILKEF
jgi:rubrerythrin